MPKFNPDSLPDLTGRVAIVTGGNTGIGLPTVAALAKKGAKVYLAARTESRGLGAIDEIKKANPSSKVEYLKLDLSEPSSILDAVKEFKSKEQNLHILVNNAGVMAMPYSENSEGIEIQWATNYVGHFRFTEMLLPTILKTAESAEKESCRIVQVSSDGHRFAPKEGVKLEGTDYNLKDYSTWTRYGQSKIGNILLTHALKKRYGDKGVLFASVHPGAVKTELGRGVTASYGKLMSPLYKLAGCFFYTPQDGASQSIFTAASKDFTEKDSGSYYVPIIKKIESSPTSRDEALADRLWEYSVKTWKLSA